MIALAAAVRAAPPPPSYAAYVDVDLTTCAPPCVRAGQPCGYGTNATCDPAVIAAACDADRVCLSFNSNGWLKGCASAACGAANASSKGTTLYVKQGGFWPPQPVALQPDVHYADERFAVEEASYAAALPLLDRAGDGWALLRAPPGAPPAAANVTEGGTFSGLFVLLASTTAAASPTGAAFAVVERAYATGAAVSQLRESTAGSADGGGRGGRGWTSSLAAGEVARLPRTVGRVFGLSPPSFAELAADQPDYYDAAAALGIDEIGARILAASPHREPTFATAGSFMPPLREYASVGAQASPVKFSVAPDGRVKLASGAIYTPATAGAHEPQPGVLAFDTAAVADWWPAANWTGVKSGLVGGFLRVVATAAFDAQSGRGVEQLAFAPAADAAGALNVRLRSTAGVNADGTDASASGYRYFNASGAASGDPSGPRGVGATAPVPLTGGAAAFYALLFGEAAAWDAALAPAATVLLPGADGARQTDAMWGSLAAALSLYVGNASNYGDGGAYWSPNSSLTSEVAPVAEALLSLGLRDAAAGIIGFYFDVFVRADGSLPECDDCSAPGGGFGDALADYGEMLEAFGRCARDQLAFEGPRGAAWVAAHLPAFARLANKTLVLRLNATAAAPPPGADPAQAGLVFGSPEHDTCHEPDVYVHNNAWLVRGLWEAADLLGAVGGAAYAPLAAALAVEAPRFAADLAASIARSAVVLSDGSGLTWRPPVAASNSIPFARMTESALASYTNFRYFAETVSAGTLPDATVADILVFRDARGGVLSGMTRFEGHLDDMPAAGYARAALRLMDAPVGAAAERFWLMSYGHAANYAARGTFSASEQLPLYADALGVWRDYLWNYLEGGIDQCVPSLTFATLVTRWQLVFEWRAWPAQGSDDATLWLARGAPRRWFNASAGGFAAERVPTSFGTVSFAAATTPAGDGTFNVSFAPPPFAVPRAAARGAAAPSLRLVLRMRALVPGQAMTAAALAAVEPPDARIALADWSAVDETATVVIAAPLAAVRFAVVCTFTGGA